MPLELSTRDQAMLRGDQGPAARMALSIVVRMAEILGAEALMDISAAHIDSTIYIGEAGLEFAERLAEMGAKVAVPTTLNVSGLDEHHWQEWPVPEDWAGKARRQMRAYQGMGAVPTWTCAPYQTDYKPRFGQQIAWGESNAIAFANSVIGARTERYPDLMDICCAITGRVPAIGLHLTENRAGHVRFRSGGHCPSAARRTTRSTRCSATFSARSPRTESRWWRGCRCGRARISSRRWGRRRRLVGARWRSSTSWA